MIFKKFIADILFYIICVYLMQIYLLLSTNIHFTYAHFYNNILF